MATPQLLDLLSAWYARGLERASAEVPPQTTLIDLQGELLYELATAPADGLPSDWEGQLYRLTGPYTVALVQRLRGNPRELAGAVETLGTEVLRAQVGGELLRLQQAVQQHTTKRSELSETAQRTLARLVPFVAGAAAGGVIGNTAHEQLKERLLPWLTKIIQPVPERVREGGPAPFRRRPLSDKSPEDEDAMNKATRDHYERRLRG